MLKDVLIKRKVYNSEEHIMLKQGVQDFIKTEIDPYNEKWEEEGMVSRELWKKAGEMGLLCIDMPTKYGGAGLEFSFSALIVEEISKHGYTGPGFFLHSDIVAPYILNYGTEQQKEKYLPTMAKGEMIGAIAMTEPGCGSDLRALKTTAIDKGDFYEVTGSKTFITNGYMSDLVIVAVRTNPGTAEEGISLLLMEANMDGFSKGTPFKKVGMKAQDTCELFFDKVKVPKGNLLGKEKMGFKIMMKELARERLIVAIMAMGGAQGAIELTLQYTSERTAFKQPIGAFQNTQFKLAEATAKLQIHQSFLDDCILLLNNHELSAEAASLAKYSATDMHGEVVDECLQLFGGYGYILEYPIARMYADNRVARIYAGTNEIMKLLISRGLYKDLID